MTSPHPPSRGARHPPPRFHPRKQGLRGARGRWAFIRPTRRITVILSILWRWALVTSYSQLVTRDRSPFAEATGDKSPFAEATGDKSSFAKASGDKSSFAEATGDKSSFAEATGDKSSFAKASGDKPPRHNHPRKIAFSWGPVSRHPSAR